MLKEPVVSIRCLRDRDRIEITLRPGFTRPELDVVRGLQGREYDPRRRVWSAPGVQAAIETLTEAFGADAVCVAEEVVGPSNDVLEHVRIGLTVRGYSPRTRKVYLGHLRRFFVWCGGGVPQIPDDPAGQGQAYILELIERRGISNSYQNQVVSALRFMCETVLGQPKLALRIPRPRKEHRLPNVMSQSEVARMLRKARMNRPGIVGGPNS